MSISKRFTLFCFTLQTLIHYSFMKPNVVFPAWIDFTAQWTPYSSTLKRKRIAGDSTFERPLLVNDDNIEQKLDNGLLQQNSGLAWEFDRKAASRKQSPLSPKRPNRNIAKQNQMAHSTFIFASHPKAKATNDGGFWVWQVS